jgi:hypothetical protein
LQRHRATAAVAERDDDLIHAEAERAVLERDGGVEQLAWIDRALRLVRATSCAAVPDPRTRMRDTGRIVASPQLA